MGILFDFVTGGIEVSVLDKMFRNQVVSFGTDRNHSEIYTASPEVRYKLDKELVEQHLTYKYGCKLHPVKCCLAEGKKAFNFNGIGMSL